MSPGDAATPRGGGFTPPQRGTRAGLGELEGREPLELDERRALVFEQGNEE